MKRFIIKYYGKKNKVSRVIMHGYNKKNVIKEFRSYFGNGKLIKIEG